MIEIIHRDSKEIITTLRNGKVIPHINSNIIYENQKYFVTSIEYIIENLKYDDVIGNSIENIKIFVV